LFANVPQPLIASAAGILAGNQSQVAGHRLPRKRSAGPSLA
jgi:hypothetical protein